MKRGKRYKQAFESLEKGKVYTVEEAVEVLKKMPAPKFDETLEISCKLNVDEKKSDQMVRGSMVLPHGKGKKVRILVFCEPEKEKEAREAGADYIGGQDLVDKIFNESWLEFDYCISTPQMMKAVSKLGRILGPRGLMPSPKTGGVTENIKFGVEEAKKGKIDFRMDKTGCVHAGVGRISFLPEALTENINAFLSALEGARPAAVKGDLIKSVHVCLSMGPSLKIGVR